MPPSPSTGRAPTSRVASPARATAAATAAVHRASPAPAPVHARAAVLTVSPAALFDFCWIHAAAAADAPHLQKHTVCVYVCIQVRAHVGGRTDRIRWST
jgi:hypothetical protein